MGTAFSGVYFNAYAELGVQKQNAIGFDLAVVSAKAWFGTRMDAGLIFNFANQHYAINVRGAFDAGAELCAIGLCVTAGAYFCYDLAGSKTPADGWNFGGQLGTEISASLGCDCGADCNDVEIDAFGGIQARVCANVLLGLSYKQKAGGLDFDFRSGNGGLRCQ
jgi:hypothetical protein